MGLMQDGRRASTAVAVNRGDAIEQYQEGSSMSEDVYPATAICEAIAFLDTLPLNPDIEKFGDYLYEYLDALLPPPVMVARAERQGKSGFTTEQLRSAAKHWWRTQG
jgi:hypothetical protein